MRKIVLAPKAPYDFTKMVRRLKGVHHELYRFDGEKLTRSVRVAGKVYLIEVCSTGETDCPELEVTVYNASQEAELEPIRNHLATMFSTQVNLHPFYDHMKDEPVIANLTHQYCGLRFILEADLFECMIKTIIGQQLNLSFASTLNQRLIQLASEPFVSGKNSYPVFPSADQVAMLKVENLREMQFSQRKAEYVIDFAQKVADGTVQLDELEHLENESIIEQLTKLRGIGRWSVECFLLFGLGRKDLLPAADIGLRNAVKRQYGLAMQPTEQEVREIGKSWSPWSSYVTFYLWESLNSL